MVNWFGPRAWDAPICSDAPRCDVPVGTPCTKCTHALTSTDYGVTMPGGDGPVAFHLACHLKMILVHTDWPRMQLVPDESDGLLNGVFECDHCGMAYYPAVGWVQRLKGGL